MVERHARAQTALMEEKKKEDRKDQQGGLQVHDKPEVMDGLTVCDTQTNNV